MSYQLFLDDERLPHRVTWANLPPGPWVVVRDYSQFVSYISKHGMPLFVSFDHDLADEHYYKNPNGASFKEKTGYDCAKWLIEYCMDKSLKFPNYQVHSMNPIGKENIVGLVENFKSKKNIIVF